MRPPRSLVAAILAVALMPLTASTGVGATIDLSLARFTDAASASKTITTDILDPPTALTATGGSSVTLSWTATPDVYASGYDVQRATVSGGPYTVVASVTPRATVTTTNAPTANGTYFYVLRSVFQNWRSANSNQASAVVTLGATSTGFKACTAASNVADTGGDGNGYETTAANACVNDNANALDAGTGTNTTLSCTDPGKDRHRWWDFGLGVPATVSSVNGIQVQLGAGLNNNSGTSWICAELSWDGGATWTTATRFANLTSVGIATFTLGGATDLWGRSSWSGSDFSNTNFRVRLTDVSDRSGKDIRLDFLTVQVSYSP